MSEKRKIQRFNLDEGRIWEAIEGLSPYKTTYTLEEVCEKLNEQQATIKQLQDLCGESDGENAKLQMENKKLQEENEQLHHELQQIKEYLQTKIDECKNHKKMKEIVFGVEQAVGYEKALLQFQKGLKRRLNENVVELFDTSGD